MCHDGGSATAGRADICAGRHAYDDIEGAARLSDDAETQMGTPGILNHPDEFQFKWLVARLLKQV